jgi:phosphoglucosamine mutase
MVDDTGEEVDGDELIFIIAKARKVAGKLQGPVVGTQMTNLGMEHALKKLKIDLLRANVGDRYVMELMQQHGSLLGGEGSGHIICLDRTTTGDGVVAALQVLAEVHRTGKSLYALKSEMSKYPQVLVNVKVTQKVDPNSNEVIQKAVKVVEKELGDSGRVLLRASGTEPLIRVMIEGVNEDIVRKHAHELADVVKNAITA